MPGLEFGTDVARPGIKHYEVARGYRACFRALMRDGLEYFFNVIARLAGDVGAHSAGDQRNGLCPLMLRPACLLRTLVGEFAADLGQSHCLVASAQCTCSLTTCCPLSTLSSLDFCAPWTKAMTLGGGACCRDQRRSGQPGHRAGNARADSAQQVHGH